MGRGRGCPHPIPPPSLSPICAVRLCHLYVGVVKVTLRLSLKFILEIAQLDSQTLILESLLSRLDCVNNVLHHRCRVTRKILDKQTPFTVSLWSFRWVKAGGR